MRLTPSPGRSFFAHLSEKEVPGYLRTILGSYLDDRWLSYVDREGRMRSRRVSCGVPQGLILEPILWNVGYDKVLWVKLPAGCITQDSVLRRRYNCDSAWEYIYWSMSEVGTGDTQRYADLDLLWAFLQNTETIIFVRDSDSIPENNLWAGGTCVF